MSSTYSIYPGQIIEANKLIDLQSVLNELPDNTTKLIEPHDLRDAVYTTWENIIFKPTTNDANIEYVGIDKKDFREKIFLGKKQLAGTDILTANLLNSDFDIFFYNNKIDTDLNNQSTKIAFLAGASSSIFYYGNTVSVPFIETKSVTNLYGTVLDLNIKNYSYNNLGATYAGGNISVESKYGNVLINGLVFPTIAANALPSDGSILKYSNVGGTPYLIWDTNTPVITQINEAGTFSISANPLLINGTNIMFSDSRPVPTDIGSITAGQTFSNVHLTEMIRRILYPYISPNVTLSSTFSIIERNISSMNLSFSYSITKVIASSSISSITSTPLFITDTSTPITYLSAISPNLKYSTYVNYTYTPNTLGTQVFTMSVKDNIGATISASVGINVVYPIFYGVSSTASATQSVVSSLLGSFNKILSNDPNQTVPFSGNGVCLYYCVPAIYNVGGSVSAVYDSNTPAFNQYTMFRGNGNAFTMSLASPNGFWASTVYNCYIYSPGGNPVATTLGISPFYSSNITFQF